MDFVLATSAAGILRTVVSVFCGLSIVFAVFLFLLATINIITVIRLIRGGGAFNVAMVRRAALQIFFGLAVMVAASIVLYQQT